MSNKELWDRVCKTDPKHVKPITGKDYSGNSPKPYWIIERLTEEFGPCGIGWGYTIDSERFERFSETDCLHIAKVTLWYDLNDRRGQITQMGQTKATYVTSKGAFKVDEDAPKKSVTDALVKCASYLGFAGDIFSGRWDDSKYVAELRKEFSVKPSSLEDQLRASIEAERQKKGDNRPPRNDGVSWERVDELESLAADMLALQEEGREIAAAKAYYGLPSNEEKLIVWGFLKGPGGGSTPESRLRAFIKANNPHEQVTT